MFLDEQILKIKRRETPTHAALYRFAKQIERFEVPAPKAVFRPLMRGWLTGKLAKDVAMRSLVWGPMFRARCETCGPGLLLHCGLPYLWGDLRLRIGDHCMLNGHSSFVASKIFDAPTLTLGNRTNIGYGAVISVAKSVTIGSGVRIADGVFISDNPGHPLDAERRRAGDPVDPSQVKPVVIEDDAWLGSRVTIMPGVHIGRGAVVGTGSVVTKSVPAYTVVAGNPARVIKVLPQGTAAAAA